LNPPPELPVHLSENLLNKQDDYIGMNSLFTNNSLDAYENLSIKPLPTPTHVSL
jgi:hypothetical protein